MTAARQIESVDDIDATWLTVLLRHAGLLDGATAVSDFALHNLGGQGRGFLSGVTRVELRFSGEAPAVPESLVIKLPAVEADRRALGIDMQAYERELRFFRDIAPVTPVRVPQCYVSMGEAGTALLVMEDGRLWTPGDQVFGLTGAQVENTLREVAKLHAHWWQAPKLTDMDWLPRSPLDFRSIFAQHWPGFLEEYGHFLSASGRALGDRMAASGPALQAAVEAAPATLVHSDLRADNLLFDGPGGEPVMLLDWQLFCRSMAVLDVARLVSGSLERALPSSGYRALVEVWHTSLLRHGVRDYDLDRAWQDFRVGILHVLYWPVCFHGAVSHEGARAVRFLEAQIHRTFRVAEEVAAIEALEEGQGGAGS